MQVYQYHFRGADGVNMPLQRWNGQPLLIVNTASECGFTPQYQKLQTLWETYRAAGLVVIAVPCNEFGEQEPGDNEQILEFCQQNYGVTFPVTERQVILGMGAHPLFTDLREKYTADILPRWNFTKYLFDREGQLAGHWAPKVLPDDPGFLFDLERGLQGRVF